MPLVYACIAPHGGGTIPRLAGSDIKLFAPTRLGMRVLAEQFKAARPETVVIASPHNLRLAKHLGIVLSENSSGVVKEGGRHIALSLKCDQEFAATLLERAERKGLPVVGANFGALTGPASDLAMDWGTLIPLWFFVSENGLRAKIVVVTPSRGIPLRNNFELGVLIGEQAEKTKKRIAFVASADQAHTHGTNGPYGFSREAVVYDRRVVEAVRRNALATIMAIRPGLVEAAKPDGLWQMAILAGVLTVVPLPGEVVSYQVPTYYGMLCAGYVRDVL